MSLVKRLMLRNKTLSIRDISSAGRHTNWFHIEDNGQKTSSSKTFRRNNFNEESIVQGKGENTSPPNLHSIEEGLISHSVGALGFRCYILEF